MFYESVRFARKSVPLFPIDSDTGFFLDIASILWRIILGIHSCHSFHAGKRLLPAQNARKEESVGTSDADHLSADRHHSFNRCGRFARRRKFASLPENTEPEN